MHYIYKITNLINGKIYIGQTINAEKRWKEHQSISRRDNKPQYIHRAIAKYDVNNFIFEVIDFAANQFQADCLEQNYILQLNTMNGKNGYNQSFGGQVSSPMKGRKHSQSTKDKISAINKGMLGINKGKKFSKETRKKISIAKKGITFSEEIRKKIGDGHRGILHTQQAKDKISKTKKELKQGPKVRIFFTQDEIEDILTMSQREAAKKYNVSKKPIQNVVKNYNQQKYFREVSNKWFMRLSNK